MKKLLSALSIAATLFTASYAHAATTARLSPSGPSRVAVGQTFTVTINVTGAVDIDTARLNGTYTPGLLEWRAAAAGGVLTNISPGTFFNATQGTFSQGVFGFNGTVNGSSRLLTITFKALKTGTATIQLAAGSKLYSAGEEQAVSVGKLELVIGPSQGVVPPEQPQPLPASVPAGTTAIMLFSVGQPDPTKWYKSPEIDVRWMSIGKPSASFLVGFDQSPYGPATTTVTGQSAHFTAPRDGVWYVHLIVVHPDGTTDRADLRIQIDRSLPHMISPVVDQTLVRSDIPNAVHFATSDDVSGIDHYDVWIDGVRVTSTIRTVYPLINQPGGTHNVVVDAYDRAGNVVSGKTEFTILGGGARGTKTQDVASLRLSDRTLLLLTLPLVGLVIYWIILKRRRKGKGRK